MRIEFVGDNAALVSTAATVVFLALIGAAIVRGFVRAWWPDLRTMGPRAAMEFLALAVVFGPVLVLQRGMAAVGARLVSGAHALDAACQRRAPLIERLCPALWAWAAVEERREAERLRERRMAGLRQTGGAA